MNLRKDALAICKAALRAADPEEALLRHVRVVAEQLDLLQALLDEEAEECVEGHGASRAYLPPKVNPKR